jgi:hypothetical protein
MKRPTFMQGVGVAALLCLTGGVLFSVMATLLPAEAVVRGVIALLGFIYVLYLLSRSNERIGRLTTVVLWLVMLAISWFGVSSLPMYLALQIGAMWLVRCLYFYSSLVSALLDLGLCGMSLAAAFWTALHTGNIFLVIWCFFVGQALCAAIPASIRRQDETGVWTPVDDEIFQRAQRTATAAVRRLSVQTKA